jgi:hypothetical protein
MKEKYKIIVRKPIGKRQTGIFRNSRDSNININLEKIAFMDMNWINMAQDRVHRRIFVSTVTTIRI